MISSFNEDEMLLFGTIASQLKCPCCLQFLKKPQRLRCGHNICHECLVSLNCCPHCSGPLAGSINNIFIGNIACQINAMQSLICAKPDVWSPTHIEPASHESNEAYVSIKSSDTHSILKSVETLYSDVFPHASLIQTHEAKTCIARVDSSDPCSELLVKSAKIGSVKDTAPISKNCYSLSPAVLEKIRYADGDRPRDRRKREIEVERTPTLFHCRERESNSYSPDNSTVLKTAATGLKHRQMIPDTYEFDGHWLDTQDEFDENDAHANMRELGVASTEIKGLEYCDKAVEDVKVGVVVNAYGTDAGSHNVLGEVPINTSCLNNTSKKMKLSYSSPGNFLIKSNDIQHSALSEVLHSGQNNHQHSILNTPKENVIFDACRGINTGHSNGSSTVPPPSGSQYTIASVSHATSQSACSDVKR